MVPSGRTFFKMPRRRQLLAEALRKGYDAGKPPSGTPQSIRRLLDAFFEGRWRHHAGKHDIDASLVHRLDIICAGADDGSYRHAVARSTPGNADRSLALGGLCIHAPFAGDDEIGLAEVLIEGERIEHGIDSRPDLRCAEGGKASAETAMAGRMLPPGMGRISTRARAPPPMISALVRAEFGLAGGCPAAADAPTPA